MKDIKKYYIFIPVIIALISAIYLIYSSFNSKAETVNYNYFLEDLNENNVREIKIKSDEYLEVYLNDGLSYLTYNPESTNLKESLLLKDIKVKNEEAGLTMNSFASGMLMLSVVAFIAILISRNRNSMGKAGTFEIEDYSNSNAALSFDDVAGNEEAKESLNDIVDFLKNPEKYEKYGAKMPKGVILYGEPGTGKTLLAKCVAGEAKVPFFALSGSDFVQMYVGVGASRVRSLFKKARSKGKAVIFIDEIDAIGKKRSSSNENSSGERDQTLNALLTEMSGFSPREGIVVIAATNRLDILDSALIRPGRFDRHIEVSLPDIDARCKILNLYFKDKPHKDIKVRAIAEKTVYFSGAKLESLVNESAILAAKNNSPYITEDIVLKAYSIILAGYEKKERGYLKEEDKVLTSFHEAGHALVSMILLPHEKISKVTIIPTTKGAGGYTLTIPGDSNYHRKDYLKNKIMVLLGGRCSEEIIFGPDKISTGAESDINETTSLALKMLTEYGMGKTLGLIKLSSSGYLQNSYGANVIKECKEFIDSLYNDTKELLNSNKAILDEIALELLNKETLHENDLEKYTKKL